MHVAIKQTILDKILDRIHQIKRQDREPEYVAVTPAEYNELRADRRVHQYLNPAAFSCYDAAGTERVRLNVGQVAARTREFNLRPDVSPYDFPRDERRLPWIRACAHGTVCGVPLYVVPPEYMPA